MALNILDWKALSAIKIHLLLKEEKEFSDFESAYALSRAHIMSVNFISHFKSDELKNRYNNLINN